ncbi:MAG: hypothetical protein FWF59_13715 [Turicibacter sp.]|nr:hypothetical protein [Turicibacter sp.]
MVAHTTIVISRYIFLAWEQRKHNDPKALGHLFLEFGEDVREIDFWEALFELIQLVLDIIESSEKEGLVNVEEIKSKLLNWIMTHPKYLQELLVFPDGIGNPVGQAA